MDAYSRIAPFYDVCTAAFLHKARKKLAAVCARLCVRRVLDAGCGTGALTRMLGEEADLAVGMDISPAMLQIARNRRKKSDTPGAPLFVLADATAPPFAKRSFDAAIFALVLHETRADADAMLRAGFSLAPRLLVLEWRMPERNLDYLVSAWVPLVERLAGKEHYRSFRAFLRAGGIRGLARRNRAEVVLEQPLAGGALCLAVLEEAPRLSPH